MSISFCTCSSDLPLLSGINFQMKRKELNSVASVSAALNKVVLNAGFCVNLQPFPNLQYITKPRS
jgi:hypothetical protein